VSVGQEHGLSTFDNLQTRTFVTIQCSRTIIDGGISQRGSVGAPGDGLWVVSIFLTLVTGNISKALSNFRHTYAMVGVDDVIEVKILTGDYLTDSFFRTPWWRRWYILHHHFCYIPHFSLYVCHGRLTNS
jgi:hypothetical protein